MSYWLLGTKEDIPYLIIYTDDLLTNITERNSISSISSPRHINFVRKRRELTFSYLNRHVLCLWKISSKTIVNYSCYCRFYCVMGQSKVFSCYMCVFTGSEKKNSNDNMSRRNIHVWLTCKNIARRTVAGLSASSDTVTIINGILFQLESNKWNGIFENMKNKYRKH